MKRLLYLIVFILVYSEYAEADHIVGAQMYYTRRGGDTIQFTFELYRNCLTSCYGCASLPDPLYIQLFDTSGTFLDTITISKPAPDHLALNNPGHCSQVDACVEAAAYQRSIVLPPRPGGYMLVYQRCCRTADIINIHYYSGTTYFTIVEDTGSVLGPDSKPRFTTPTPQIATVGQPFTYAFAATDPEGDSLAYRLAYSYDGADINCVDPSPANAISSCPTVASPPPYQSIIYMAPYTYLSPANDTTDTAPLHIDPVTGVLSGIVNQSGTYLISVAADEYRNGMLIGTTLLDFTFTFTECLAAPTSVIEAPKARDKIYSYKDQIVVEWAEPPSHTRITCYDMQGRKIAEEETSAAITYKSQIPIAGPEAVLVKLEQPGREPQYKKVMLQP